MNDSNRIALLEQQLVTLGPLTHKQKTQELPALIAQCRDLRKAGKHGEADIRANQIEALDAIVKDAEKKLDAIERELYSLRSRQHHRSPRL